MNYSQDDFFELMDAVEAQQGTHLDEQCVAKKYIFSGKKIQPLTYPGCGNSALFMVPYEGGKEPEVKVCAVDDDMGRWPRFGGDKFGIDEDDDDGG